MISMENKELHTEKVKILSRLIKESSLSLEEALLLLKEEEVEKEQNIEKSSLPLTGYIYTTGTNIGTGTTTPSSRMTIGSTGSISFGSTTNTVIADNSVDLNN
jgi:hypothetical protein